MQKTPNAWVKLIGLRWCNEEWKAKSCAGRECRAKMRGRGHRQGSAALARYRKNLKKKLKRQVYQMEAYVEANQQDGGEYFCTENTANKVEAYSEAYIELYGTEKDWRTAPIDARAVHKAGGGQKHGCFLLADGFLKTASGLADPSAMNSESEDDARPCRRRRANPGTDGRIEELQQQLQQEREERQREWEQRDRENVEREREREQEREQREREREREREEREREHLELQQKVSYFTTAFQALQSKLNIDFLPPCPLALQVALSHPTSSGSAASNGNSSPAVHTSVEQVRIAIDTNRVGQKAAVCGI